MPFTSTPTSKVRSLGTPEREKGTWRRAFSRQQIPKSYAGRIASKGVKWQAGKVSHGRVTL